MKKKNSPKKGPAGARRGTFNRKPLPADGGKALKSVGVARELKDEVLRVRNRAEQLDGNVSRLEHQAEELHHPIDQAHHMADALHGHAAEARGTDLPALVTDDEPRKATPFPIVGIGASAGGYEAFADFLTNLPKDTGM